MSMEDSDIASPSPTSTHSLPHKTSVLFLCAHNSCRSQMAEHFTRALFPHLFTPYSAGLSSEPQPVDPLAVAAMREEGVDISHARSKSVKELAGSNFDYVVTVCECDVSERPDMGRAHFTTHVFDNPPALTASMTSDEEKLAVYRRVAREIKKYIETLPTTLAYF